MHSRSLCQSGFTLTNIIVIVALIAGSVFAWKFYGTRKLQQETQKKVEQAAIKIRDHLQKTLKHDGAWKNTLNGRENPSLTCLRDHTSCTGKGGLLAVRDPMNRMAFDATSPANGFTIEGAACSSFIESGSDDCPFRMDVRWEPHCVSECVNPENVTIVAKLLFRPGTALSAPLNDSQYGFSFSRDSAPADPRNCLELLETGRTQDGTYSIRPDPKGQPFPVYCDQTRDGGGWALVVSSAKPEIAEMPFDQAITPYSHARMPVERLNALLSISEKQSENNIRMIFPDIDGGLVIGASSNGGTEAIAYKASMPKGECRTVEDTPSFATKTSAPYFSLELSGNGNAGYTDRNDPVMGYIGFHVCFGSSYLGTTCGTGCKRSWTGSLVRQKGTLWIR